MFHSPAVTAALELGYGRRFTRLLASCPAAFGAVTRLSLTVMRLRSFDAVLAACTKLESLRLYACDLTGRAGGVWRVRHPRLAELRLMLCAFLVVELEWLPRQESFAYNDWATVETSRNPVVFGHVPRLSALKLFNILDNGQHTLRLSRALRNTAVRYLRLSFLGCDVSIYCCPFLWSYLFVVRTISISISISTTYELSIGSVIVLPFLVVLPKSDCPC